MRDTPCNDWRYCHIMTKAATACDFGSPLLSGCSKLWSEVAADAGAVGLWGQRPRHSYCSRLPCCSCQFSSQKLL